MDDWALFAVLGLGGGAATAGIAISVTVVRKALGILNIAAAAHAVWGALTMTALHADGRWILPIGSIDLGSSMSTPAAVALGVLSASVLGSLTYLLVVMPLRRATELARMVSTIGITIVLQALIVLRFGSQPVKPPSVLPTGTVAIASTSLPVERMWMAGTVVAAALATAAVLRHTRAGLVATAASEGVDRLALAGRSPAVVGYTTWTAATLVGSALFCIAASSSSLGPSAPISAIVPGVAAALLAGARHSVIRAAAAGLAIGIVSSVLTMLSGRSWWPSWMTSGIQAIVPLVLILLVLLVATPSGSLRERERGLDLPPARVPTLTPLRVGAGAAVGIAAIGLTDGSYRFGVITSLIFMLITLSFVFLAGFVGQVSVGQIALAGTGGFLLSKWSSLPFPVAPLLAATATAAIGMVFALPALRFRGTTLVVVTLGVAVAVEQVIFRNPTLIPSSGLRISAPSFAGIDLSIRSGQNIARFEFGLLVLGVVAAVFGFLGLLVRSRVGALFLAVRDNEAAAASLGVRVAAVKVVAFGIAAFLAGLGGAFIGYSRQQLSGDSFAVQFGLVFLALCLVGGISSFTGAVVSGLLAPLGVLYVVAARSVDIGKWYGLISGIGLVATIVSAPGRQRLAAAWATTARRRAAAEPVPTPAREYAG